MKNVSKSIVRIALVVQFLSVLFAPALVASSESPRGTWMAEWLKTDAADRTIGVLTMRDGKLSFTEQVGDQKWDVELTSVKRVSIINEGKAMLIVSASGQEWSVAILQPNLSSFSPKKAFESIECALQAFATNR